MHPNDKVTDVLGSFLREIHLGRRDSRWLLLLENEEDKTENLPKDMDLSAMKERQNQIALLGRMSLQRMVGLDDNEYFLLLKDCRFLTVKRNRYGEKVHFKGEVFKRFLVDQGLDGAEHDRTDHAWLTKKCHFVLLGGKEPGYFKSAVEQIDSGVLESGLPRIHNLLGMQRDIQAAVRKIPMDSVSSDESSDEELAEDNDEECAEVNAATDCTKNITRNGDAKSDGSNVEFPILNKFQIDTDLSKIENANFVKDLIGECFALQSRYNPKKKATNEYRRYKSTITSYCVSLPKGHKNDAAFDRYHLRIPYIQDFIDVMSRRDDGATRLARFLAKYHTDVYVAVGQEMGLGLEGVMDEVEAAAM